MRRKLTVFVLAIVILLQALNGEWVHDEWEYVGSYQKKAVPTFQQSPKIKVVLEYTGGYEKKEPIQGDKDRAQLFYESKKPKKESALSKAIDKVNSSQEVKLCKEFLTGVTFGHENSDSLLNSLFGQMAGLDMSREQREYWEKLEQTWQTSQFEQQKIPADQSGAPSQAFEWGASIGSAGGTAEVLAAIASALGSVPIGGNGGNPGGAVTNGYGNVYQVPASAGAGSVGVGVSAMTGGGGSTGQGKNEKESGGKKDSEGAGKDFTSTEDAAQNIGKQFNGNVTELKNGYKVDIPNPSGSSNPVVVRVMNEGSGGRTQPYFRVSIDGKGSYTLDGVLSSDRGLTHIDMSNSYLEQITNIVNGIGR